MKIKKRLTRNMVDFVRVDDDFIENCPEDHMCCLLDTELYNTSTDKRKKVKEFFYISEEDYKKYCESNAHNSLFAYFFVEINPKKKRPKYEGWSIGGKGAENYFYDFEENMFRQTGFIRRDELREKLPGIFKPTHKERIEEVVV